MATSKLAALKKKVNPKIETTKAKSKTPTIETSEKLHEAISSWREAKRMENEGKAMREASEGELLDVAADHIRSACNDAKKVVSSVNLVGRTTVDAEGDKTRDVIQATQVAKYSKMSGSSEDKLQSIFTDRYEKLFETTDTITVKNDISEELQDRVIKALTEEFGDDVGDVISITSEIKPTEAYTAGIMLDNSIRNLHKVANESGLCKLQKISFKLK